MERFNWLAMVPFALAAVLVFILAKVGPTISTRKAREQLKNGALLIDVRSTGEFADGHLPGAINLPLDQIGSTLPAEVPDQHRTLLLHCASGIRSGLAKTKLKQMGYKNVFNLGSLSRAASVVKA